MKRVSLKPKPNNSFHQPINQVAQDSQNANFFEKSKTVPIDPQNITTFKNPKNVFQVQRTKMLQQRPSSYKPMQYPSFGNEQIQERYTQFVNTQTQPTNVGMMNPLYINIRSNPRKMYSSHNINVQKKMRKQNSQSAKTTGSNNKIFDPVYQNIVNEMNDYFQMMKLSSYKSNCNKLRKKGKNIQKEKQCEMEKLKKMPKRQWTEDHLNVVGLKPNPFKSSNDRNSVGSTNKLVTEQIQKNMECHGTIVKYNSSLVNTEFVAKDMNSPKNQIQVFQNISEKKMSKSSHNFSRKSSIVKKFIIVDYFGKVKEGMSIQEINKIKAYYYKDLIWKCWFSRGWKIKNVEGETPKFFVGKGNNSRLIKAIMNRRWWWKMQSKEQNANFNWTQLKLYSIYQNQQQYERVQDFDKESDHWHENRSSMTDTNCLLISQKQYEKWREYYVKYGKKEMKGSENFEHRKVMQDNFKIIDKIPDKVSNHIEFSRIIGNKKALYKTMMTYYSLIQKESKYIPMTYHITSGLQDDEYLRFLNEYYRRSKQDKNSMWIIKPGEMSNRGRGIKVCHDLNDIKAAIKNKKSHSNGKSQSYIIQQYILRPFLYNGRKFDIRHFIMVTSSFGKIQGYFYQEGYIRTASYKYNVKHENSLVHLTNDALQKKCKEYGKYEKGNKVSYQEFQKYLSTTHKGKYSFYETILPKIREISNDIMNGSYYLLDPKRKGHNFEIFGLDVMIDSKFKPYLIQVNTNPCLQLSSPILAKLIPKMLDNAFAIAVDPLFPPPELANSSRKLILPQNYMNQNKFELIFDEQLRGNVLNPLYDEGKKLFKEIEGFGSDQQAYESADDDYDY